MKVAVLLAGGVDSSVALHLAKAQGAHDIRAFYLKIWLEEELAFLGDCPWEDDLKYVRAVCEQAKVPLEVVPLQSEYEERVVGHTLAELKKGRTPSPDILCNEWIKFGLFFDRIGPEFQKVISGHYAQIEHCSPGSAGVPPASSGKFLLKRSADPVKDQTYFLSRLNQQQLSRLWFPIGHLKKKQVRELAQKFNLPNKDRKDSQGICFLGKIKYPKFVRFHLGEKRGDILEIESGKKLGEHLGVWFHTVGQRKGLRLPGGPWYVVRKDLSRNIVYVAHGDRYLDYACKDFTVRDVHWIAGKPANGELQTKVRHSPYLENCRIRPLKEERWAVSLENKDQGIASGQSAIFYDGEICLGGGVIE